jgi:hypothetical protein
MKKALQILIPPITAIIAVYFFWNILDLFFIDGNQPEDFDCGPPPLFLFAGYIMVFILFGLFLIVQNYYILNKLLLKKINVFNFIAIVFIITMTIGVILSCLMWSPNFGTFDLIFGVLLIFGSLFIFILIDVLVSVLLNKYLRPLTSKQPPGGE